MDSASELTTAPLRAALRSDAEREARRILVEAAEECRDRVASARDSAAAILVEARRKGAESGRRQGERELARARAEARSRVLRARADLLAAVHREAQAAVAPLASDDAQRARLARWARADLGDDAGTRILDAPGGGVVARVDDRGVDYSLSALLERCLARLGPEIAGLWE